MQVLQLFTEHEQQPSLNDPTFEGFWKLYPRRVAKKEAQKAFLRIRWTPDLWLSVKTALENHKRSDQWQRGFIPYASTWLNGERWEDELEVDIEVKFCEWRGCNKPGVKSLGESDFCETHYYSRKRGESPCVHNSWRQNGIL